MLKKFDKKLDLSLDSVDGDPLINDKDNDNTTTLENGSQEASSHLTSQVEAKPVRHAVPIRESGPTGSTSRMEPAQSTSTSKISMTSGTTRSARVKRRKSRKSSFG